MALRCDSGFGVRCGAPCGRSGHSTRRTFLGRSLHRVVSGTNPLSIAPIILGLNVTDMVLLLLTLVVSMLTFALERTNVLQGAVHLLLFLAYLILLFEK